jgi:hypothetical protein
MHAGIYQSFLWIYLLKPLLILKLAEALFFTSYIFSHFSVCAIAEKYNHALVT